MSGISSNPVEAAYLRLLATIAGGELGGRLVGAYAGGSWALGGYTPGRSDLDVALVVDGRLNGEDVDALAGRLSHGAVPCPARRLELVVYERGQASSPDRDAGFELNLNTGSGERDLVQRTPKIGDGHWFAIDRDIYSRAGLTLSGASATMVFAGPPDPELAALLADSVAWHRFGDVPRDEAILNACRGLLRMHEGIWYGKEEAGELAAEAGLAPRTLSADAVEARDGGPEPRAAPADVFLATAERELRELSSRAA